MSTSVRMASLSHVCPKTVSLRCFSAEHGERWQVVVPFHDRWQRAEATNRVRIQRPDGFSDFMRMGVDEQRASRRGVIHFWRKASDVEFCDGGGWKPVDEEVRVVPHVVTTQV